MLFAGAGISTENPLHSHATFYQEIRSELKVTDDISFPALMTRYCEQVDGRIKLIQKIKHRFDYFRSFTDFYFYMTRFHQAISPLYMVKDIITTNWDDFFERECMIDAFSYDGDVAFLDAASRRLLKIHGSISNFGSLVATEDDYKKSYKRLNDGPLGAYLKSLIARKTVIYVGYSLSDHNYLRLLKNIAKLAGPTMRQSYFVSPNIDLQRLATAPVRLIPIETDGSYFFETVRDRLSEAGSVIRETAFGDCDELLDSAILSHNETADAFAKTKHPLLILALSYQDGLVHALKRILNRRKSGEYHSPHHLHKLIHSYEFRYEERGRAKDFWNAAYTEGYKNGLMFLHLAHIHDDQGWPPMISMPWDCPCSTLKSLLRYPKSRIPTSIARQLKRIQSRCVTASGEIMIPDHTPYL